MGWVLDLRIQKMAESTKCMIFFNGDNYKAGSKVIDGGGGCMLEEQSRPLKLSATATCKEPTNKHRAAGCNMTTNKPFSFDGR